MLLVEFCIETKLRILNERISGDSLGYNTYFGPRGSSTIDYFIVFENLFEAFHFINVCPPNELSDHSVVWCGMKTKVTYSAIIDDEHETVYAKLPGKFIIDDSTKQRYTESLLDNGSFSLLQKFLHGIENDDIDIDTLTKQFANIINFSAQKSTKFKTYNRRKSKKLFKKKWFNNNCYFMKRELRKQGEHLQMDPNNFELKVVFHRLKKNITKLLR